MLIFDPVAQASPARGMVLRLGETDPRYLRITHLFYQCVYAMWVGEPEKARYARRPVRLSRKALKTLVQTPGATWGRLALPDALTVSPPKDSERALDLDAAWNLVEPLAQSLERESNLSRSMFTTLIQERAKATDTSFITLRRMLLRYYYFGQTRLGLLPLPTGVTPTNAPASRIRSALGSNDYSPKRRGRQSILTQDLGKNDFVVSEDDIADMVAFLKSRLRHGVTFLTHAHEEYLGGPFRRRHPSLYAEYIAKQRPEPVSVRQFRYYIDRFARLENDLAANLRTQEHRPGRLGSLYAAGPGEVYEIDATGGRLHLVTNDANPIIVGKPTIYLIMDRWSRFVVAIYLSLQPASYEEVRHALLIAFTSRKRRFQTLGIDVDDKRWPMARVPAVLCPDRGSEFTSGSMEQAVVHDLRMELTPLPPFCPDGKAIVERTIRELKRRMAGSRMKGTYAERPLDPQTARAARLAEAVAIHSLTDGYRVAIEYAIAHNNRPHSALKRRRILTRAGVAPIPRDAYLWGLEHITGLRTAPLSDRDYQRLLLSSDKASLGSGIVRYKSRSYRPANEIATEMAARSSVRSRPVDIRLDKMDPEVIFIPTARREWAEFHMTAGAANDLAGFTLDEEEAFTSHANLLWARADNDSRIERLASKAPTSRPAGPKQPAATKVARAVQQKARQEETRNLKRALVGKTSPNPSAPARKPGSNPDWKKIEEEERRRSLDLIRKQRTSR
ncbi:integrase catalytic domain-containing protein [Dyella tabacisoli]|uniref:Transposase n=1 Tax=Dyella tabacisoli TaxID=2282381 RepID=A0A369UQM8_9GAMM|nr:DDE-type integrase/transposase/recombinase [Dyella tabacisoli]RDD82038.1 transposase [Dyella tabacisoli]